MPGMGGRALAQSIARMRPETRILFMTGHAERGLVPERALPPGTDSLQKPFRRDALLQKVREMLEPAELQADR